MERFKWYAAQALIAMGHKAHPTTEVENWDGINSDDNDDEAVTLNGHALDSLEGVEAAFDYLNDDYNDGWISRSIDDTNLFIISRYRTVQHMGTLLDAHAAGDIQIVRVGAKRHSGEVRTEVVISNAE